MIHIFLCFLVLDVKKHLNQFVEISIFIKVTFNVARADPPTPKRHFDAKRGKHRYVSVP